MKQTALIVGLVLVIVTIAACAPAVPSGPTPTPTRFPTSAVVGGQLFEVGKTRVQVSGTGYYGPGCTRPAQNNEVVIEACRSYEVYGTYTGIVTAIEEDGYWNEGDMIRVMLENQWNIRWYHRSNITVLPYVPPTLTPVPTRVPTPVPTKTPKPSDCSKYKVVAGDNLWSIASTVHTSVDLLKSKNGLKSDTIYPEQLLAFCWGEY